MADCAEPVYLPASFKGAQFNVESSSDEFGRRGHLYEYPLGEQTGFKDLGRKARRFKVEGYLIGSDQVAQTNAIASAAESPEPGMLIHPIYGPQMVSCVSLTTSADYRKDKKRTKLQFEFVEANTSMAPFAAGGMTIPALFGLGSRAVDASKQSGTQRWVPTDDAVDAASDVSSDLADEIDPATDEASYDAMSALERGQSVTTDVVAPAVAFRKVGLTTQSDVVYQSSIAYRTFDGVATPLDKGTATIRRIHLDALERLRDFNRHIVTRYPYRTPSIDALIITARLSLIRDYALVAAQKTYTTVHAALVDLDFVVDVYDEEEEAAVAICHDELTVAIRAARAGAVRLILNKNIRLPGIVRVGVDGVWPSLVVSHKRYFDGRRYQEVENYNPHMIPFFIGRQVTVPAE